MGIEPTCARILYTFGRSCYRSTKSESTQDIGGLLILLRIYTARFSIQLYCTHVLAYWDLIVNPVGGPLLQGAGYQRWYLATDYLYSQGVVLGRLGSTDVPWYIGTT